MITFEAVQRWLTVQAETEILEFKEAKSSFDQSKLLRYCAAIANEGGGHLLLGITDRQPRQVVGTKAFATPADINQIKKLITDKFRFRVEIQELAHPDGRILVFSIPSRPTGHAYEVDGAYLMRAGESLVPMTPDKLKRILTEDQADWFAQPAKIDAGPADIVALLDTQAYFELIKVPYPTTREGVLERLVNEGLISRNASGWTISNLGAILFAKNLGAFSPELARKAPRVVIYEGTDKIHTREDNTVSRGYAVAFESLVNFVHSAAPLNRSIEQVVREEVKMFPKQALRELIANAMVHQNFLETGASIMIEMYEDRVEISNPGTPPISVDRFIDEYRSRNERLADVMRRLGICEEKGSGVDKAVKAAEVYQLPAPDFRVGAVRTSAILFAHQDFSVMSKADRMRACYQHCCLMYVSNQRMSNQSLRERFGLGESKTATVSLVIGAAKDAGLIKADESETTSTRYARYLPHWA